MKICMSSMTVDILLHLYKLYPHRMVNVLRSFGVNIPENEYFFNGSIPNLGCLMLDSGTYSLNFAASVTEEKVSIEEYIPYVQKHQHRIDYYSNFDRDFTIYGFKENLASLKRMEQAGLKPFPVIHNYYNNEIRYYLNQGYRFLALGSIMKKGSAKKLRRQEDIEYALSIIPTDEVMVHLFGASSYKSIAHLPLYSCDSSSWALNNKFGFILYWNPSNIGDDKTDRLFFCDKMRDYQRNDRKYFENYAYRSQLEQYIKSLGFEYYDLMGPDAHHYRQLLNAIYYLTIEEIITKKQEKKKLLAA